MEHNNIETSSFQEKSKHLTNLFTRIDLIKVDLLFEKLNVYESLHKKISAHSNSLDDFIKSQLNDKRHSLIEKANECLSKKLANICIYNSVTNERDSKICGLVAVIRVLVIEKLSYFKYESAKNRLRLYKTAVMLKEIFCMPYLLDSINMKKI